MELKFDQMDKNMKECINKETNKAKVNFNDRMDLFIMVNLTTIILKDKDDMNGLMAKFIVEVGLIIKCLEKVNLHELMEGNILEII